MHHVYNSCCCFIIIITTTTALLLHQFRDTSIFHSFVVTECRRPGIMMYDMEHAQKMHLIIIIIIMMILDTDELTNLNIV